MSNLYLSASFEYLVQSFIMLYKYVRDVPLDIWGGGGVFVACKLFFYLREKTFFFWRSTCYNFFLCFVEEICCRMLPLIMYVTIWCFFWSTYFSSISTKNFFFCPHFQQTFFSDFCGDKLFFSSPPPPRYQMVRPLQTVSPVFIQFAQSVF